MEAGSADDGKHIGRWKTSSDQTGLPLSSNSKYRAQIGCSLTETKKGLWQIHQVCPLLVEMSHRHLRQFYTTPPVGIVLG